MHYRLSHEVSLVKPLFTSFFQLFKHFETRPNSKLLTMINIEINETSWTLFHGIQCFLHLLHIHDTTDNISMLPNQEFNPQLLSEVAR